MSDIRIISLCGLSFASDNLGCGALAYSFVDLLKKAAEKKRHRIKLYIISNLSSNNVSLELDHTLVEWQFIEYHFARMSTHKSVVRAFQESDLIVDFTEGDSFTDIYGAKRLIKGNWLKFKAIESHRGLLLGPQTYGPFNKKINEQVASVIIKRAMAVYSRDELSAHFIDKISGRQVKTIVDVAFALPYQTNHKKEKTSIINIGVNVSGLLWNNGYTGNNELGLRVNYKEYIFELINHLTSSGNYKVHLVPHVLHTGYNSVDNDIKPCDEIHKFFPDVVLAPRFESPMDAKSYISQMDVFTGARMHATIAAFSSGVPVIPFSYSRKFEGLYKTLNYPYCINGKELDTKNALEKTIRFIDDYQQLKKNMASGLEIANQRIEFFVQELEHFI